MTKKPSDAFLDGALGACNALRLFAHNAPLPETTFQSSTKGEGAQRREMIHFRSTQSWGDIVRDAKGITLTVHPIPKMAENFVSRKLSFTRPHFANSSIMTWSHGQFIAAGGRDFAVHFAHLIRDHFDRSTMQMRPVHFSNEDHLLVIPLMTVEDAKQIDRVDALTRALIGPLSKFGLNAHVSHPNFDQPAMLRLIDENDHIHDCPADRLQQQIDQLAHEVSRLPSTMRLTLQELDITPTYNVFPHCFTLAAPKDSQAAAVQGILTAATIGIEDQADGLLTAYQVTVIFPRGEADPLDEAERVILSDWENTPGTLIKPRIISRVLEHSSADHYEVRLQLLADPEAAHSYNEAGCYDVLPV